MLEAANCLVPKGLPLLLTSGFYGTRFGDREPSSLPGQDGPEAHGGH